MKPDTRLSSAVFQLTPTRTRCDLIIIANDKKEKIASGLLNPFLSHLKTAQDQITKGGYSIFLEPEADSDAAWFTKATLERFVRFVSTPEILERVYTIETEILQIEEAKVIQSCNHMEQTTVEDQQEKPMRGSEGNKYVPMSNVNEEKAIVIYKPEAPHPEANGSCLQEENSKVQLLKILETRKTVLQKEQGMAFARAVAAGFDIDNMAPLVSFAESFGAMRLLQACSRFRDLWKRKHETGQWLDIEASEVLPTKSDFSATNASGIILSGTSDKQDESNPELAPGNNGKLGSTNTADHSVPDGQQKYFQGQIPHPVFPSWPMHTPPGAQPVFPAYPVQGMPYYQTYAGNGPFFQPPHWHMGHSPSNYSHQSGQKRQSLDDEDNNTGSERWEIDRTRSLDDMARDTEVSETRKPHKKTGGSNKKQGMVVIRNINYITSTEKKSGSESNSDSDSDTYREYENFEADGLDAMHRNSKRSSKDKGRHLKSLDRSDFNNGGDASNFGKDSDDTHWQAFQNCLLRGSHEDANTDNEGMFSMDKDVKRLASTMTVDPLAHVSRDPGEIKVTRMNNIHEINGKTFPRPKGSGEVLFSRRNNDFRGSKDQMDIHFAETRGRKVLPRTVHEDFIIGSQHSRPSLRNSLDQLDVNDLEGAINMMDGEPNGMTDEAFIVPFRSMSIDQIGHGDRSTVDIDSEIPSVHQKLDVGNRNKDNYEPDGLSLMPERGTEKRSVGYDLALDYEMQVCAEGSGEKREKEVIDVKGGLRKSDKDRRSKVTSNLLNKQSTGGPMRKGKSLKTSPLEDARARAERLRSYKADLQKQKKEKEEAELKRIEALKLERQKRIAARGNSSTSAKPSTISPQIKQMTAKLSPANTNRGSKFSDSEPGSSSPLQRSKIRTSLGLSEPPKASKASKLSDSNHTASNRLSRSSSSLSEPKKEINGVTPDFKASMARIRRLSEPKTITNLPVTSIKARSDESLSKRKLSEGPERNKISAIMNLDRSKAATLPELKMKTAKAHANSGENGSSIKDKQKVNVINPSVVSKNAELNVNNSNRMHQTDVEDNPIIEKTVVMLECEKRSLPTSHSSESKLEIGNPPCDVIDKGDKSNVMSKSSAIHASPLFMHGVDADTIPCQPLKQSDSNEVRASYPENFKTSLASPASAARVEEIVKTHVPDVKTPKVDKTSVTSEKTVVKEPSKGFKRLLKFGKKNYTSLSVDQSVDSDCTSADGTEHDDNARNAASSSEVHTLKNFISQDETSTSGNASQKSSRNFSLLSPFWSKTSEKKQAS